MAESDGLHVVVGGTGATGRLVARQLAAAPIESVKVTNISEEGDIFTATGELTHQDDNLVLRL
jgi:prephenate dehydrogenase